jgi:hypothetical protein
MPEERETTKTPSEPAGLLIFLMQIETIAAQKKIRSPTRRIFWISRRAGR